MTIQAGSHKKKPPARVSMAPDSVLSYYLGVELIMRRLACAAMALLASFWPAGARGLDRALIVDLEMNPPAVLAGLMDNLRLAGFRPAYRPFYPRLTHMDLRQSSLVVILSGPTPGAPGTAMSLGEVQPLEDFVRGGGILVLGPSSGSPRDQVGDHDRYLFNLLLHRLGASISIGDDWVMDEENCYNAPLWKAPLVLPLESLIPDPGLQGPMVFDRSPSLAVGEGVLSLVRSHESAFLMHQKEEKGPFTLGALARCGKGMVLVMSRHVLTHGGANSKEPASPMLPMPGEEARLRVFLRNILGRLKKEIVSHCATLSAHAPPPSKPDFTILQEPFPDAPPPCTKEFSFWKPVHGASPVPLKPSHRWISAEGVRSGWAHMDKDEKELERLAYRMMISGLNTFWGVAHPQVLLGAWGSEPERARLLQAWQNMAALLAHSEVRWLLGMNYPGGPSSRELPSSVVGAEGRVWSAPSPWDLEAWEKEVVSPARVAAYWSKNHPAVAGLVLDLEMYGRSPLFFGNGVDFGDAPFKAFLQYLGEPKRSQAWELEAWERFPWLRDEGLLESYYQFLEKRAQEMGRSLREAVLAIREDWVLGCYMAGILHRWFYRGLLRGLGEAGRPVLIFTFQRDVGLDMEELRGQSIHAIHVRGLLMGMMKKRDYPKLFAQSLGEHGGYWLNRLTSLVAEKGFYPIEAPGDMSPEEAWGEIRSANEQLFSLEARR